MSKFLNTPGEMASLIAAHNWAATDLGPVEHWPLNLKTVVGVMIRSSVPMVLLWGTDGRMIFNDAYAVFAGGVHKLGRKVLEGWPEVADFNANVLKVCLAGGSLVYTDHELTLFRKGRSEQAWMNLDYSPVVGAKGQPEGVLAIVVETTPRVLSDRRVALEQERQRLLLQKMPGFVGVLSGPEHVYIYVNDAYVSISERTDFIGRKFRDVFSDLESQAFAALLDQAYATGEPIISRGMELRLHGQGNVQYIDFVFQPIRDDAGVVAGIFIGGYEVTDHIRAAEALRKSEAKLQALNADLERQVIERTQARGLTWQLSPDLMGALNSDGYFQTSNPAWQSLLGWSEEEVARTCIFDLLHPDDIETTRQGFELTQLGQPAIQFPNRYRCKDGTYRWISWVGVPDEGMVYCTGRDITEAKRAEAELASAQEALRQAQKMEAVGQLTGGIAHDFNNLLAGISGSLEFLNKRHAEGRYLGIERYINLAKSSTQRAASLTQRLLAFSRRQTLDPKPIAANRLVAGMEDLIRRTVGPSIELEVVAAGGLWVTKLDPPQLENSILNLAINARDAMPDGGRLTIETANRWLESRVSAGRDLPPGQYISISVTDNGTGMSPDVMARAFDPFFTTKPLGNGTGLGLSMVHGFVRQSGGQVQIYSEIGKGTTVSLYLPRFLGGPVSDNPPDSEEVPEAIDGETILVIEDDESVRTLITEVLNDAGYCVLEAGDGPSGLRVLQERERVTLLITDVGLPGGLNGRQVADAARSLQSDLKILFITGYAENAAVGNGHLPAGMQVMTKPFALSDLGAKVREVIEQS